MVGGVYARDGAGEGTVIIVVGVGRVLWRWCGWQLVVEM